MKIAECIVKRRPTMKKYLLFTVLTVLLLSANSSAGTADFSDTCATLSLTGPDADPGEGYSIEATGKVNSGYSYYAWFYIDGVYNSYSYSFFSTSFTRKYGPFTGPHTFKVTIQGGGAMNLCKRSVELTVAPKKKDPKEMAADICTAIGSLPDSSFKNNPSQRKNAFCEKTDEVIQLIEYAVNSTDPVVQDQFYQDAIEKLQNDIGAKMDSFTGGEKNNDWVTDEKAQEPVYGNVQKLIKELQDLQ